MRQLKISTLTQEDIEIGEEIIGNINDDGYLKINPEEIAQSLSKDIQKINTIIAIVQGFEPVGVCAKDLKECLLIQLAAKGKKDTLIWKIAENYLEECGKKQYLKIAKAMGVTLDKVKESASLIPKLEPKPGRQYSSQPAAQYIIPDIYIRKFEDEYQVLSNKSDIPILRISTTYNSLLKDKSSDKSTTDYIKQKIRAANFLIKCVRQRQETMQKIMEYLVKEQSEFIEKGRLYLKPLNFKAVANAIGRNESTISRAVENKYVDTPAGIYELREFFNSAASVKEELKDMIAKENKAKPLSDQKLEKILEEKNIKLSRRAIAKYREELKIPPSYLRKP